MISSITSTNNFYFDTYSVINNKTKTEELAQKVLSSSIEDNQKIISHLVEASATKLNPIALAFQKNDFVLAEQLFKIPELEHPGYEFRCHYNQGEYPVWLKPVVMRTVNGFGVQVYKLGYNRVDLQAIKLLVKYDSKKIWKSYLGDWLIQSYGIADLEAILNLYPLSKEFSTNEKTQNNHTWNKVINFFNYGGYRFDTDPFLSDFPVKDRGVPIQGSSLFEYRKDDNALIREYKKLIQEMIWGPLIP